MTFDELAGTLLNGLHDAELCAVTLDFAHGEACLDLDVWIGDEAEIEAYRRAQLRLSGLSFWISEAPDPQSHFAKSGALRIDSGLVTKSIPEKQPPLPPLSRGKSANWIFVSDWNAFIYFAADSASLTWSGERTIRKYSG